MVIAENAAVHFHYKLTDTDGVQLDASPEGQPMGYLHGHKNIIPGLEKELEGKSAGDSLVVNVPAAEAYGEYMDQMVQQVPRERFPDADDMQVGMRFQAQTKSGTVSVVVTDLTDEHVTVDGNHALAGKDLTFDVTIAEVREATEQELKDGHLQMPHVH